MIVKTFRGFWDSNSTREHEDYIFIFGDNNVGSGMGGQACIRYEKNAFGIPTKKEPSSGKNAYYTDDDFFENVSNINKAIKKIINKCKTGNYRGIFLPEDGLGTGIAKLDEKAPLTFKYLKLALISLKEQVSVL